MKRTKKECVEDNKKDVMNYEEKQPFCCFEKRKNVNRQEENICFRFFFCGELQQFSCK